MMSVRTVTNHWISPLLLLATAAAPAAVTAAERNPFLAFAGNYRIMDVECVREGSAAQQGCAMTNLFIEKAPNGKVTLWEYEEGFTEQVLAEPSVTRKGDVRIVSTVSGNGAEATWERHEIKQGTDTLAALRIFFFKDGAPHYHVYWREHRDPDIYLIWKATYRLKLAP